MSPPGSPTDVPSSPIKAKREPDMPMPGGDEQMRLIDTLEQSYSLYELCLELSKVAESLAQNPVFKANGFEVKETVKAFRQESINGWKLCELLHGMHPKVIQSIIQGTVAYDLIHHESGWYEMPRETEGKVAGIYAVGICRAGKAGRFVNIPEMRKLIKGIKQYIKGYEALAKHLRDVDAKIVTYGDMANLSKEEIADLAWVARVDEDRSKFFKGKPRARAQFIQKDDEVPSIKALVRTYERMCRPEITEAEEPIRMKQSPVYVGCSADLSTRTKAYRGSSLKSINKPMALTLAVLFASKIPGEMHLGVALLIWKSDQLPLAEQLVATLAGSLVYQHGFNATEAGGTGSNTVHTPETLERSARQIMLGSGALTENIKATIHELENREGFLKMLDKLEEEMPKVNEGIQELVDLVAQLPACAESDSLIQRTSELIQDRKKELNDTREALAQWDLILKIKRRLLGLPQEDTD
ncbi:hypothetical protein NCS52_01005200 [Fusarium sp. LHS14.1]|nr:hypothetical protein NCS52_01005200 [Fusarium sp. LHS14.1]